MEKDARSRAGALPAPLRVAEERMVGPSLGSDSIRSGLRASLIGAILILVFMAVFYNLSGMIANFALVLKQSNHLTDCAHQLEQLLASHPKEARAHLALANLYAQQLNQPAKARPHYLKVLELNPGNPQASAIQFWLAANPP